MTEIRFYHLTTQPLERALPAILGKVLSTDRRALVLLPDAKQMKYFNDHLWTYTPESFLPHGLANAPHANLQPICLTTGNDNPNGADVLVLCNPKDAPDHVGEFALCCDFLDGQDDEAVLAARTRWKQYKEAGHTVSYWQQTETGGWEQKA